MSSMAFTKSTQARHPLTCQTAESLTALQTSLDAADRPVAPPRFDPGLSTGPGGFTTGDPGVSPNRTLTGWPSRACTQLRHDSSFAFMASPSCWTHVDRGLDDLNLIRDRVGAIGGRCDFSGSCVSAVIPCG